jgi:hypothetical protein
MREPIGVEALRRADVAAARALMEFVERQPGSAPWSTAHVRFPVCTPKVLGVWPDEEPWLPAIIVWALYHGFRVPATGGSIPPENTPAAVYLAHVGRTIAASTRRYIEAALREPFRIWEVVHTDPGRFVSLKITTCRPDHVRVWCGASRTSKLRLPTTFWSRKSTYSRCSATN